MVFFINSNGTLVKTMPSAVNQGSAGANDIYLLSPFGASLTATIRFKRADGYITEDYPMTPLGIFPCEIDNYTASGWFITLPAGITEKAGLVTAQATFYADGNKLCTSAFNFNIEQGVEVILPEEPSAEIYEAILSNISALETLIASGNFASRSVLEYSDSRTYGVNEVVVYGRKIYRSLVINNNHSITDTTKWELIGDFAGIDTRFGIVEGDITSLGNRMTTAEGKITNLQGDVSTNASDIAKILSGELVVKKAERDGNGNVFTSTYETQAHASSTYETIADADLIKGRVAVIENLIDPNDNSLVDRIQEVLEVFANYPEGVDLASVIDDLYNSKVDKLTTIAGISLEDNITESQLSNALFTITEVEL